MCKPKNLKLNEESPKVGFRRTCCSTKIGAKTLQSKVIDHGIFDSASAWLLRCSCISVNSCDQNVRFTLIYLKPAIIAPRQAKS